jgi:hypothetical protein
VKKETKASKKAPTILDIDSDDSKTADPTLTLTEQSDEVKDEKPRKPVTRGAVKSERVKKQLKAEVKS